MADAAPPHGDPDALAGQLAAPPRLTEGFVQTWLTLLEESLGWQIEYPFSLVRTLTGRREAVCLPLLSYAHADAVESARLAKTRAHAHVRHLAAMPEGAAHGTPVVSVLPLASWPGPHALWEGGLSSNLRKKIRRAAKDGIAAEVRDDVAAAVVFYRLFAATMHRHGTPPLPAKLFELALERGCAEVHLVRRGADEIAAYFVLFDAQTTLFAWAGFHPHLDAGYASLVGEWSAIESAYRRGCTLFDFGRSPLGSASWSHKQYWRPVVFHATRTPAPAESVYQKYAFAARLWRRLPEGLATRFGPSIIRRLPDA